MMVSSAVVTTIFADELLDTALSLLKATIWIGIGIGLSVGGVAINGFQVIFTLVVSVLISLGAIRAAHTNDGPQ